MRAAVLHELGTPPRLGEFREPEAADGQVVVEVAAAGLNHLDLGKASGSYYGDLPPTPFVTGTDGVGRTPDGRRVYFDETVAPFGTFAERTLVPRVELAIVPEGLPDEIAAALGNAGVAAMTAVEAVPDLGDRSVLVLGATGAVGQIAVQLASRLGAARVVAAGLGTERLDRLRRLGAAATIDLGAIADHEAALGASGPYELIVDLLWGEPILAAMKAAAEGATVAQFGALAGRTIELDAALLRSRQLTLKGISGFKAPRPERIRRYERVAGFAADGLLEVDVEAVPLADIATAWERQRLSAAWKLVVVP